MHLTIHLDPKKKKKEKELEIQVGIMNMIMNFFRSQNVDNETQKGTSGIITAGEYFATQKRCPKKSTQC